MLICRLALVFLFALAACKPEFADDDALISAPRVVAVQATPAEAAPLVPVSFEALYVTPGGAGNPADLSWAYCVARKPLTDEGTLAPECLAATGMNLVQLGTGQDPKAPVPALGCQLFGPDLPPPTIEQPSGRPVDPDPSGGYFQPVRLLAARSNTADVGTVRLSCGLASATPDQSIEFNRRYRSNENPAVASLHLRTGSSDVEVPADSAGNAGGTVSSGAKVSFDVGWAACPSGRNCGDGVCDIDEDDAHCPKDCLLPRGCSGAERYLFFDPDVHDLVEKREEIRVSWFATAGKFDFDRTDRASTDTATTSTNTWTAPNGSGDVHLWVVLRDDRGGVGWQSYRVTVSN